MSEINKPISIIIEEICMRKLHLEMFIREMGLIEKYQKWCEKNAERIAREAMDNRGGESNE